MSSNTTQAPDTKFCSLCSPVLGSRAMLHELEVKLRSSDGVNRSQSSPGAGALADLTSSLACSSCLACIEFARSGICHEQQHCLELLLASCTADGVKEPSSPYAAYTFGNGCKTFTAAQ